VAVIDLKTLTVAGKIDAGGNPMGWPGRCNVEFFASRLDWELLN